MPETGSENWKILEDQPYYVGFVNRETAEEFLKKAKHGTFLVRRVVVGNSMEYVVSVKYIFGGDEITFHLIVRQTKQRRLYWLDTYSFKTIIQMLQFHVNQRVPIRVFEDSGVDIQIYEHTDANVLHETRKNLLIERRCKFVELKRSVEKPVIQIYHEQFHLVKEVGSGAFGEVYLGYLERSFYQKRIPVAIKKLLDRGMTHEQRLNLLKEADVMKKFDHINVVKFYGVAASKDPIMIAMEFCEGKSLEKKIMEETTTIGQKLNYLYGASKGLQYIHEQKTIHRDIAARNCLLDGHENVKISDFGLSLVDESAIGKQLKLQGQLPIRCMAPETNLHGIYTFASDVYSFGAMMYEVFHKCVEVFGELQGNGKVLRKAFAFNHIILYLWERPPGRILDPSPQELPLLGKKKDIKKVHKDKKKEWMKGLPDNITKEEFEKIEKAEQKAFERLERRKQARLAELKAKHGRNYMITEELDVTELVINKTFDQKMEKPEEKSIVIGLERLFQKCRRYCPEDRATFLDGQNWAREMNIPAYLLDMIKLHDLQIKAKEKATSMNRFIAKVKRVSNRYETTRKLETWKKKE